MRFSLRNIIVVLLLFIGFITFTGAFFIVNETKQAIVLQFGDPRKVITEPGLQFKIPFIQDAVFLDSRLLNLDPQPEEMILSDQKRIIVDSFARYKIVDPLKFLETVRTENGARSRLDDIVYSELRVEIGTHDLMDVVTENRNLIMAKVTAQSNIKAAEYGIEMADVRIKRVDLPPEIANSIFNRMRTERQRIAMEYRSEGKEESTKIRAQTDKEKTILIAEAYKQEQTIRGEGDGMSTKIYADAFSKDPKFYSFMRSMEAYKNSLNTDTTLLMSEESDFLGYLNKSK